MGMFDSLYGETGGEWQTKALGCALHDYRIGDRIPHSLTNFQVEVLGGNVTDGFVYSFATVHRGVLVSVDDDRDEALPLVEYSGTVRPASLPRHEPLVDTADLPWPHDPSEIVKEALRDYVGDGEGIDESILAAHNTAVRRQALLDFAAHLNQRGSDWSRTSVVEYIQGEYIEEFVAKEAP